MNLKWFHCVIMWKLFNYSYYLLKIHILHLFNSQEYCDNFRLQRENSAFCFSQDNTQTNDEEAQKHHINLDPLNLSCCFASSSNTVNHNEKSVFYLNYLIHRMAIKIIFPCMESLVSEVAKLLNVHNYRRTYWK